MLSRKSYLFLQEDGSIDSAALCAQLASREILVAMLEGTDAAILDILFGYPAMQKNLLVAERKIEVPLQWLNNVAFSSQAFALSWVGRKDALGRCSAISSIGKAACSNARKPHLPLQNCRARCPDLSQPSAFRVGMIGERHLLDGFVNDAR